MLAVDASSRKKVLAAKSRYNPNGVHAAGEEHIHIYAYDAGDAMAENIAGRRILGLLGNTGQSELPGQLYGQLRGLSRDRILQLMNLDPSELERELLVYLTEGRSSFSQEDAETQNRSLPSS